MARDHARLLTSTWNDEDFRNLTVAAQHAYWTVTAQAGLSYAGVLDYRPGRLAALAKDNTAKKVDVAIAVLLKERFAVLDRDTEELVVRTFIKHDRVLERVNMGKACARAFDRVVSLPIRAVIIDELGRLYGDQPTLAGWAGFAELNPDVMDRVQAMASTIPFPIASNGA